MEVPSTVAGVVKEIKVKLGDELAEGAVVALIETDAAAAAAPPAAAKEAPATTCACCAGSAESCGAGLGRCGRAGTQRRARNRS